MGGGGGGRGEYAVAGGVSGGGVGGREGRKGGCGLGVFRQVTAERENSILSGELFVRPCTVYMCQ